MDAQTLARAMPGLSLGMAEDYVLGCNQAMLLGQINTLRRAAMFLAQVGAESISLRYTEEIASGAAYEGRIDLGNTQPGDGVRFKGRSFIQITGRTHYQEFSLWANSKGLVPAPDYFITYPTALASPKFAWMGAVWYWTVARPTLNTLADAGDIIGATRAVNGALNNLDGRRQRWVLCLALGASILPTSPSTGDEFDMATLDQLEALLVKHQGLTSNDVRLISIAVARGGSLYMNFPAAKNPAAIYRDEGMYLRYIPDADLKVLASRYGGAPYVVSFDNSSIFYQMPIVPGTADPRQ